MTLTPGRPGGTGMTAPANPPWLGSFGLDAGGAARKEAAQLRRPERLDMTPKIKEHTCVACNGTGFPLVLQPVQPGRKIFPVKCEACAGKGKITDAR